MAASRPLVLLYQELSNTTVTVNAPSQNTLIVGPAYHIKDYSVDKADIAIGLFGAASAHNDTLGVPVGYVDATNSAVSLSDAPANVVGGVVDMSSASLWIDEAYIDVAHGTSGAFGTLLPDLNLFEVSGASFANVRPGDRLIVTDYTTTPSAPKSLAYVVNEVGGYGASTLDADQLRTRREHSTAAGTDIQGTAYAGFVATSLYWRIERRVVDQVALNPTISNPVGSTIVVNGGIVIEYDLDGDGVVESCTVNSGSMYLAYRALRTSLALVTSVTASTIESIVGRVDERNPAAVGLTVALANTTTSVLFYGITGDDLNGVSDRLPAYQAAFDQVRSVEDIYAIVPLDSSAGVISALRTHVNGLAAPEKGKPRVAMCANSAIPTTLEIGESAVDGVSASISGDAINVFVDAAGSFDTSAVLAGDTLVVVTDAAGTTRAGSYTVTSVYADSRLQVGSAIPSAASATATYYVLRGTGALNRQYVGAAVTLTATATVTLPSATADDVGRVLRVIGGADAGDYLITARSGSDVTVSPATLSGAAPTSVQIVETITSKPLGVTLVSRAAFRRLTSVGASFVTAGVVAGDFLQIPTPAVAAGTNFASYYSAAINVVQSDNTVDLVLGSDIPTVNPATAQTGVGFRVIRSLNKDGQVSELVSTVASYADQRLVMVLNAECLVSGVTNALTGLQSRLPGYYLACAVGGMSAGLPPQQPFTFLGIAGIDRVYGSSSYFDEDQIDTLSNNGWYVFLQDSPSALPYSAHQLTTDVTSLDTSELSFRRSYDYAALSYKTVMQAYIGRWNIIPGINQYLQASLDAVTADLRAQNRPRIGPVLFNATVNSIQAFDGTRDRLEVNMTLDIPRVLNRIGLRLVA